MRRLAPMRHRISRRTVFAVLLAPALLALTVFLETCRPQPPKLPPTSEKRVRQPADTSDTGFLDEHANMGFPLLGRHREIPCDACHGATPPKPSCASCHRSPHGEGSLRVSSERRLREVPRGERFSEGESQLHELPRGFSQRLPRHGLLRMPPLAGLERYAFQSQPDRISAHGSAPRPRVRRLPPRSAVVQDRAEADAVLELPRGGLPELPFPARGVRRGNELPGMPSAGHVFLRA
jgi:hypothetical protein